MHKSLPRRADGLQVLLVCPNRGIKGELTRLFSQKLPSATVQDQAAYPTRNTLVEWLSTKPNVCFMEVGSDPEKASALIADMAAMEASMLIIAVLATNDPDLLLKCLRQGAAEFLTAPFTEEQFLHVMERISRLQPQALARNEDSGHVYCVMSAKGSCGSSTIAANLAYVSKRPGGKRVLLADLDPLTGITSFLLKTPSKYSFLDVLTRAHDGLDADIWKGIISTCQGVDLLLSPENPIDAQTELPDGSPIVTFSRHLYDTVIIDAHTAYGAWSVSLAKSCDELLLVTGNDLASLQSAQRVLAYLDRHYIDPARIRLVVNRFSSDGLSRNVIETALHCDVCQIIPEDSDSIHRAIVEGKPVASGSAFGKSVKELADKLSGRTLQEPAKKPSSLAGLLSMFSRTSS